MAYRHIEPLVSAIQGDSELQALASVIAEYRKYLAPERWSHFQARVAREWSIETGQIEGLYHFERGLTMTLIEEGITVSRIPAQTGGRSPEEVMAILRDHLDVLEGLFAFVKGERQLSKSYIHELHQALLRNQRTHTVYAATTGTFFEKELVTGQYKRLVNNPTRPDGSVLEFCPPEQVEAEMDRLIALDRENESAGVPIEIRAAWLHHAFTHVHPYPDGNGRVARALATLVLIKGGLMPLVVPASEKQTVYVPALEKADEGDLQQLVAAIRFWQGRLIVDLGQRVEFHSPRKEAKSLDDVFDALELDLLRKDLVLPERWRRIEALLPRLASKGRASFDAARSKLESAATVSGWGFAVQWIESGRWTAEQMSALGIEVLASERLILQMNTPAPYRIALDHALVGPKKRGLGLLAMSFADVSAAREQLLGRPFLVNFAEDEAALTSRFERWLERCLFEGIETWRRTNFG